MDRFRRGINHEGAIHFGGFFPLEDLEKMNFTMQIGMNTERQILGFEIITQLRIRGDLVRMQRKGDIELLRRTSFRASLNYIGLANLGTSVGDRGRGVLEFVVAEIRVLDRNLRFDFQIERRI